MKDDACGAELVGIIRALFDEHDIDNNGVLTRDELVACVKVR